ncbi:RAQPRD family integrative conjugative element protein [Vibrio barjaei]|uniref:RAQPRD family integrative conjugative element protein n=1 Tax=Vibrio barjaei TaxID=1676683 RepID=UPI00228444C7|nr:RAQPRD family integrative conjugative element protein [Vibrio barjaei]MCY9874544.1 RAQPRD family integrative conjugative element protein [Vibrio barjaei]
MNRLLILFSLFVSATSSAGVWEEREILKRYVTQLDALNSTLLEDAELAADKGARIQFDYDSLGADANNISLKIKHYLESPMSNFSPEVSLNHENNGENHVTN